MNSAMQSPANPSFSMQPLRPSELAQVAPPQLSWLWHGYLAPGKVTVLISPPKTGKTTLATHLLARLSQGGQLASLAVAPARALVISEESAADWDARCRRFGLAQNIQFLCRPFQGARPTNEQWFALIAGLEDLRGREGLDLIVIDALASLLPGHAEMSAPKMLDCLLPLQALAQRGPAVWVLHHPTKKSNLVDGQSARGSGALAGFADIVMEMSCFRRARSRDRRRRLCGYSRYEQTPRHVIFELNADGNDYLVRTDAIGRPLVTTWPVLNGILERTTDKLSQEAILEKWPQDEDRPDRSTLSRWLKRATQQGVVCRSGAGHNGAPFCYWLPGREPLLWPGSAASEAEKEAWRERIAAYHRQRREQAGAA